MYSKSIMRPAGTPFCWSEIRSGTMSSDEVGVKTLMDKLFHFSTFPMSLICNGKVSFLYQFHAYGLYMHWDYGFSYLDKLFQILEIDVREYNIMHTFYHRYEHSKYV